MSTQSVRVAVGTASGLVRHAPLAWCLLALATTVAYVVLVLVGPHPAEPFPVARGDVVIAPIGLTFAVVGALLARRLPTNPIGWLLGAFGATFAFGRFGEVYAAQGLVAGATRPGAAVANWLVVYGWAFGQLALAMALLHFPTGTLPSRRWRPLRVVAIVLAGMLVVVSALLWPVRHHATLLVDTSAFPPLAAAITAVVELPVLLTTLAAVVSLVPRHRSADAVGRLQLRWLFAATGLVVTGLAILLVTDSNPNDGAPLVAMSVLGLGMLGIPVSIAVAVLRYRLYEIDRLLSRTAAWSIVSVVLVGTYFAVVVALQSLLRPVVGEGDVPVALATLVAAASARPLLRHVRGFVDRRFNRAQYDAARTVETFARDLRDEVSLEAIVTGLRATTTSTVQPAVVGVVLVERRR